ncbi:MAG TPA: hypothetical protein PLV58_05525 [Campylobacterales bacterium]|nr:hypothetical protein [Campylobacterales bacterium]
MQTIQLNVDDSLFAQAVEHIKSFVSHHKDESNFKYKNDADEVVEVINGKEYIAPTKKDIEILNKAIDKSDYISGAEARKALLSV